MKEKKKMTAKEKNEATWAYFFVAPTMIGLIILNFYPAINTVYQSFCKTGDFGKGNIFVGLANYQKAFSDPEIWQSLWNTIKYALIEVPFGVVIALILAVFLNKKLKGTSFLPHCILPAYGLRSCSCGYGMEMALQSAIRSDQQYFPHEYRVDFRSKDRVDIGRYHWRMVDHRL